MNVNISNFMEERRANTEEEAPYMEMRVRKQTDWLNRPSASGLASPSTLDTVAPLRLKKIKENSPTPWYNEHTQALKRAARKMERNWKKTKLEEKLQIERKEEYNLFLRGQEGAQQIGKTSSTPQALERDGFGSITPKYPAGSPEVQAQRGIQGPENIVFSRRNVATLTEPTSGVPKVSRPRRQWAETPDRWEGPHRDQISSDEEIELLEKERLRNIQEDIGANRRGGKHSSHRIISPVFSVTMMYNLTNHSPCGLRHRDA
ncbi:unnamed protein product [Leuciscus chuanchicus]